MKKNIVVTGGLGFIGSHTVVALQEQGHEVLIIDDLSNTSINVLDNIEKITGIKPSFFHIDLKDKTAVFDFFNSKKIDGIIHFAASKAVGESMNNPLKYYENNIASLVYVLQAMEQNNVNHFIFSSSCTVYGESEKMPITENAPIKKAESPYGNTKKIGEEILRETTRTNNLKCIALRYFNPIGAHKSSEIGELPIGVPQNLIPYITQTAIGIRKELSVFGDDYPTADGSAIRDYIHVVDLAEAHIAALNRLLSNKNEEDYEVYNIGTGRGTSVLEVIKAFEKATKTKLPYKVVERRPGDIIQAYANTDLAEKKLGWKANTSIEDSLLSAWKWQEAIVKKEEKL